VNEETRKPGTNSLKQRLRDSVPVLFWRAL
jgi:hypothetical protein